MTYLPDPIVQRARRWARAIRLPNKYQMEVIDATCPLVEKVHSEARRFASRDLRSFSLAAARRAVGTMGWAPEHIRLVFTQEDVDNLEVPNPDKVSYITQTTLSVDDCDRVVAALRRFRTFRVPRVDICYATTNRQAAVNALAPRGHRSRRR